MKVILIDMAFITLDRLSRQGIYDASHKGHLPFPPVRLHQSFVYHILLSRLISSAIDTEDQIYDTKDLAASLDRIEAVDFHSTVEIDGIRFTPYHAGHVLGAAMYFIEIAGVKVLHFSTKHVLKFRCCLQETIPEKTIECSFQLNSHPQNQTS
jgi:hypothetical protein